MVQVRLRDDGSLSLDPWIFEDKQLTVSVEVRRLKKLKFDSNNALQQALDTAKIEVREWQFRLKD